ncbi:hypothetical protein Pfra02_44100 [Pseudomonas fragi]|nr:hypothetical protein Pfra02_44100 [Pseudomonas fragi]
MNLIIVALLAVIAIVVAPWLFAFVVVLIGAYGAVVIAVAAIVVVGAVIYSVWQANARARAAKAMAPVQRPQADFSATLAELAVKEKAARARAEAKAVEAERLKIEREQSIKRRSIPCPHCNALILKGSMYCASCGKAPVSGQASAGR